MTRIADLARKLNVSGMTIRRHIERKRGLLRDHVKEEGGITIISPEGVEILMKSISASNIRPSKPVEFSMPAVQEERLSAIEKSILALVDEVTRLKAENQKLRQERLQPNDFERFYASFFQPVPRVLETARQRYEYPPMMIAYPNSSE